MTFRAAADKRLQFLLLFKTSLYIYNVVTGSTVAVSLDASIKSEVAKAAQQLKAAGSEGVLVSGYKIKCSIISDCY
jgi:molybdopterin-containing oxidoreductase family iron-sulfur binding subunit